MTDNPPPATGGFIQFGNGPAIPAENIRWTHPERKPQPEGVRLEMLRNFSAKIELPFGRSAAAVCRAVGMPEVADRIEVETHPDLIELDVRIAGEA